MATSIEGDLPLLRLIHLVSPSLPVGGFTYSQGLEWAVEAGWVRGAEDLEAWLADQIETGVVYLDLPLLVRMQAAAAERDQAAMAGWIDWLLAGRETAELRREEGDRGRALADLLVAWGLDQALTWKPQLARSQAAGFAYAAAVWRIGPTAAAAGYAWAWLENLVLAAVKLVPLGQTQGQQVLARLAALVPGAVETAMAIPDDEIGASLPALAIASSAHETQYTRLFRS
ncbi:MAG: urease accessory protein UreF [Thiocapsa sp.]|jgi:urease accessory protein|nr:urease accessory UreF family protein [Thiocapsa sp.]MCG6896742.1 urease accessory protein UreF [Thiocapsa sp.]MCG6984058.1 urease accessory protein UreF [Thiocapsa sp.]